MEIVDILMLVFQLRNLEEVSTIAEISTVFLYQEISQDSQIYPTEEGRLKVGPVTVLLKLDYKGESFEDYATIESFSFDSIAKDKTYSFSSDDVSLEVKVFKGDELIEKTVELNRGDVLVYRIKLEARDTSVLFFPKISFEDMAGVSQYSKVLSKKDSSSRESRSILEKEISLVFNRPGSFKPRLKTIDYLNSETSELSDVSWEAPEVQIKGIYISERSRQFIFLAFFMVFLLAAMFFKKRQAIYTYLQIILYNYRCRKTFKSFYQRETTRNLFLFSMNS